MPTVDIIEEITKNFFSPSKPLDRKYINGMKAEIKIRFGLMQSISRLMTGTETKAAIKKYF